MMSILNKFKKLVGSNVIEADFAKQAEPYYLVKSWGGRPAFSIITHHFPETPQGEIKPEYKAPIFSPSPELLWESRTLPYCKIYRTARLPFWYRPHTLVVKMHEAELPEIFAARENWYVSEDTKKIIESIDPDIHQFWPVAIVDKLGAAVSQKNFFTLNIGRKLQLDDLHRGLAIDGYVLHCFEGINNHAVATIESFPQLKQAVGNLPLWQTLNSRFDWNLFINYRLLRTFQDQLPNALPELYNLETRELEVPTTLVKVSPKGYIQAAGGKSKPGFYRFSDHKPVSVFEINK